MMALAEVINGVVVGPDYNIKAYLDGGASDRHIHVEYNFFFDDNSHYSCKITQYINPHYPHECDCVVPLHPKRFKLRMTRQGSDASGQHKLGVYIMCDPDVLISPQDIVCYGYECFLDRNSIPFVGWQYVTTLLWTGSGNKSRLYMNLYLANEMTQILKKEPDPENILSENLVGLLKNGTYSDITLSSVGGSTFKAHKCILAERSPMFRAMFEHEDKQNFSTSFTEETLRQMLTYMYTDKTPEPEDITRELFVASDYYQLPGLKIICAAGLCRQVTIENAASTLELAVQLHCDVMIKLSMKYIKKHISAIAETEDWKNMKSVDVMKVLFQNDMKPSKAL